MSQAVRRRLPELTRVQVDLRAVVLITLFAIVIAGALVVMLA